jgi:hypothetical protein
VWTNDEKKAIFARMEEYFRMHPNGLRKDALREAQSVLNSSRWIVVTDQRVFNYKDRIEIARANARKKKIEKPVEAPAPILTPPPVPERKETPTERLAGMFEQLLDILADKVADRVYLKMLDAPVAAAPVVPHRPKHDPRPVPSHVSGIPRPGVLVIGLLPAQAHHVSQMYYDRLDMSFFTAEEAVTFSKLTRAHTILMTKFINHSVQDKYRKSPALHFCNGGVAELMGILDKL